MNYGLTPLRAGSPPLCASSSIGEPPVPPVTPALMNWLPVKSILLHPSPCSASLIGSID